jgi:3-methyladenine DNA glycosylase Tag
MERKTYGYQFQMVQLIVRKTKKMEAVKVEKQPLNALQTERGSFMIQSNPLNHI